MAISASSTEELLVEQHDRVAVITLNRPEADTEILVGCYLEDSREAEGREIYFIEREISDAAYPGNDFYPMTLS